MSVLLSISYFPNVQYLSKLIHYTNITIEQQESYSKQSYRNRCQILSANLIQDLIIPVKKSKNCSIRQVEIDYSTDWQRNHFRAIMSAYRKSPFYEYYETELYATIYYSDKYLWDLCLNSLSFLSKNIGIAPKIVFSEDYCAGKGNASDFRNKIHPKSSFEDDTFVPHPYIQVFADRFKFIPNMSGLDLLFNCGPESINILKNSIRLA